MTYRELTSDLTPVQALTWMKARESIAASETWYPSLLWKALPLSSTGQSLVINLAEGFALQQEDEMSPFIQAIKGNLATDGYTYEAKKRESAVSSQDTTIFVYFSV